MKRPPLRARSKQILKRSGVSVSVSSSLDAAKNETSGKNEYGVFSAPRWSRTSAVEVNSCANNLSQSIKSGVVRTAPATEPNDLGLRPSLSYAK